MTVIRPRRRPSDFGLLLAATAISRAGTQVSVIALPLVAVVALNASTFEAGLLAAAETAAFLLIGLPAGVWVDRLGSRPVMLGADLVRGVVILAIPVAAALDLLTLPHLYTIAFIVGVATVLFDVGHMSYVPFLVGRDRLMKANSRLEAVDYTAFTVGPGLGGALVQVLTAPVALVADAVSYGIAWLFVNRIRGREPVRDDEDAPTTSSGDRRERMWPQIRSGIDIVVRSPALRAVMAAGAMLMLFDTAWMAIQPVFLVREIGLPPVVYGVLIALGSAGGLAGALCADPVVRWFGMARVLRLSFAITTPFMLLMPFAEKDWRVLLYALGAFTSSFGAAVFNVAQVTLRQVVSPPDLIGRVNATMRFAMWGAMPVGGLVGGALGQALGVRPALWVFAVGTLAAALPLLTASLSPSVAAPARSARPALPAYA
jgi:MFS family permease